MKISCSWDYDRIDETKIVYKFGNEERIARLDFLQDCIGILTEKYNEVLEGFEREGGSKL